MFKLKVLRTAGTTIGPTTGTRTGTRVIIILIKALVVMMQGCKNIIFSKRTLMTVT
jgi:hypothetical protein